MVPDNGPADRLEASPEGRQVFREPGPLSEELAARQGAGGLKRSAQVAPLASHTV